MLGLMQKTKEAGFLRKSCWFQLPAVILFASWLFLPTGQGSIQNLKSKIQNLKHV
jgi:hypothetical protein